MAAMMAEAHGGRGSEGEGGEGSGQGSGGGEGSRGGESSSDAGRPALDTIAMWLGKNGGVDAVLAMADGKDVALIWDADGHSVITGVDGSV